MPYHDKDFPKEPVISGLGKLKQQDTGWELDWSLSLREREQNHRSPEVQAAKAGRDHQEHLLNLQRRKQSPEMVKPGHFEHL